MTSATQPDDNPYVGPRPLEAEDKLFGRDREVQDLLNLLIAEGAVLLYSPSGAGKTSLVQAGLVPRLQKEGFKVKPLIRLNLVEPSPGPSAVNCYVLSTLHSWEKPLEPADRTDADELKRMGLADYLGLSAANADDRVLIFDQFEELLTIDRTDLEGKKAFFAQVAAVLRSRHCWALFCLREEYLAGLDPYLRPLPVRLDTRYRLNLLEKEAARSAIQNPAQKLGVHFTDDAANELIQDLCRVSVQRPDGRIDSVAGPYVEPVHLQVVCKRLWEGRKNPKEIATADVKGLGGLDRPLAAYYAEVVKRAAAAVAKNQPSQAVSERTIREWIEKHLTTELGLRSQVPREKGGSRGLRYDVIEELQRTYLVRGEDRLGGTWYELSHDRLVGPIRLDNAAWRKEHLQPFQKLAADWRRERRPDFLLRPSALRDAEKWATEHPKELSDDERDFLKASNEALSVERRTNLTKLGWGVIFARDADPAVRQALAQLLDHRRGEAGHPNPDLYKEFVSWNAYRSGESAEQFLDRHKADPNSPDPARMPYYLLIVGGPGEIPFEFQYGLARRYAVGRLHFETLTEYEAYARSVVASETGQVTRPRELALYCPLRDADVVSQASANLLVRPLAEKVAGAAEGWTVNTLLGAEATKERLSRLLGAEAPALLLTAGVAMSFPPGHTQQQENQGALVGQDWPGFGKLLPKHYFAAGDVTENGPHGLIAFLLAPCAAGTPKLSDFFDSGFFDSGPRRMLAEKAFVARLPQRLLGHPQGGALAVVSHVDNLFVYSFTSEADRRVSSTGLYEQLVRRLADGHTVGSAMEGFNRRYTEAALRLNEELQTVVFAREPASEENKLALAERINSVIDARNFIILGDPAVRLAITPTFEKAFAAPEVAPRREDAPTAPVEELLYFNGVNGATGEYLLPPMSVESIASLILGEQAIPTSLQGLKGRSEPTF
jgi:hypothetical protein